VKDDRFLYTDDIRIRAGAFDYDFPDGMYAVHYDKLNVSSTDGRIEISGFAITPKLPKQQFARSKGHQLDWINAKAASISFSGVDMRRIVQKNALHAQLARITGLRIDAYKDKRLPPKPGHSPPMPHDILPKLGFPLHIHKAVVVNGEATYEEHAPTAQHSGTVTMKNFSATAVNVTNEPALIRKNIVLRADAQANVMGTGLLKAHVDIPLGDPQKRFSYHGTLGRMKFADLNPMTEPAVGVKLMDGVVEKIHFNVRANSEIATGTVTFVYKDLKIKLSDVKNGEKNGFKEKIGSFVANNLVIQSNNPDKDKPLRPGIVSFARDKSKGFLHYGWNAVLSGLKSSMGVPEKEVKEPKPDKKELRQEKKEERKEERIEKREESREERKTTREVKKEGKSLFRKKREEPVAED
ncbi:MAG: hypothetical protein M3Q97_05065, partial [Bacteroidota bacterium]|nr:hypothetical protein [Bacteroidota bacterium]